jgi:hypothetical protein
MRRKPVFFVFFGEGVFMSLQNSFHSGSFRRNARNVLALVLFVSFLFIGCNENAPEINTGFIPVGEWKDSFNGGYNITTSSLEYYTADMEWEGTMYSGENIQSSIKETVNFSKDAGVLIVQITSSSTEGQNGKFIGVYYKEYTASHVFLANAIDESYALILKDTLAEAKNTFNVDNVGTHVTMWGSGYNK